MERGEEMNQPRIKLIEELMQEARSVEMETSHYNVNFNLQKLARTIQSLLDALLKNQI